MTEQRVREIIREELAAGSPPWADDKRQGGQMTKQEFDAALNRAIKATGNSTFRESLARELGIVTTPTIDRSLRGWVLVTQKNHQSVRWANAYGLNDRMADNEGFGSSISWELVEDYGWTVEPFPTGYTIADIETVLNEIFDDELARNKDGEKLWPGIARVVTCLHRLKENV
jgi:hypothetical protein